MTAKDTAYKYLSLIVVTLLAMTACTSEDDSPFTGERALTFAVGSEQTRATTFVPFTGSNFGVTATKYSGGTGSSIMSNVKVMGSGSSWSTMADDHTTPKTYYWPMEDNYYVHFAAYAPHSEDPESGDMKVTLPENLYAGYTFSGKVDGATNWMFADEQNISIGDYKNFEDESVPINLHHTLTQVKFDARLADAAEQGTKMIVTSLKVKDIRHQGEVSFTTNDGSNWNNATNDLWTLTGNAGAVDYLREYIVTDTEVSDIGATKTDIGTSLYLMPQALEQKSSGNSYQYLEVKYKIVKNGEVSSEITDIAPLRIESIIENWKINQSVKYSLEMVSAPVGTTLTVNVQPWVLEETVIEFVNTVSVDKNEDKITWIEGTYSSTSVGEKIVLLDDISQGAQFTFRIGHPLGGMWQAFFISKGGNPNAFTITPSEGAVGELTTVTIKANQQNTSNTNNQAELRFVVRHVGNLLPVKILSKLGDNINYLIIQNMNK